MSDPIVMLRRRMKGKSLRDLAKEIPCSAPYLSDVMNGNRGPGPRILAFLGLQKRTVTDISYRREKRPKAEAEPEPRPTEGGV